MQNKLGIIQETPFVSIIIPVRNESKYISACLDNILQTEYPLDKLEILVVDGNSTDGTVDTVAVYSEKHPLIKLLNNSNQTVPYGMNLGIAKAKGEIIIRMDAHAGYPLNYIRNLINWMWHLSADNVGGVLITHPGADTEEAKAVALILSHPFGVGNALFRIETDKRAKEVDTVPFGCYRKNIFEKIGLYDEMMTRNQDDELNARLKRYGGKIFLIPEIHIDYYARSTLYQMAAMLYQYGYFKPLVGIKVGQPATLRQFIPPIFVAALLILPVMGLVFPTAFGIWLGILITHTLINFYFSFRQTQMEKISLMKLLIPGYVIAHIAYGIGYIRGIIDFLFLKKHKTLEKIDAPLTR